MEQEKGTQPSQKPPGQRDRKNSSYETPKWVSLFTQNPQVLAYRWYKGDNCPSGEYSYRDDLYIFDAEEALSRMEVQDQELESGIIGTEGFHDTAGHICIALSEEIKPSNHTAIHELAHAVAYVEYGLTGHNKIHDEITGDFALRFHRAGCKSNDIRLIEVIGWQTLTFSFGPEPTRTPVEQALSEFCNPTEARVALTATATPTEPRPTATPKPTPSATDRFLEIHYDASGTLNNRQPPVNDKCSGGSGAVTRWSRTEPLDKAKSRESHSRQ